MIASDLVNGEDRKSAFPALAILTTPGPINGQATLNKYEVACSPVHEALHLTWDKVKYCDGTSCTSSSSDQDFCNEEARSEKGIALRRHPSYLQRDAFQNIRSPTDLIRKTTSSSMIKSCFVASSPDNPASDAKELASDEENTTDDTLNKSVID